MKRRWTTITEFAQAAEAAYQLGREDMAWKLTTTDKPLRKVTKMFLRLSYLEHASPAEEDALLAAYRAGEASASERIKNDKHLFAPGAQHGD